MRSQLNLCQRRVHFRYPLFQLRQDRRGVAQQQRIGALIRQHAAPLAEQGAALGIEAFGNLRRIAVL